MKSILNIIKNCGDGDKVKASRQVSGLIRAVRQVVLAPHFVAGPVNPLCQACSTVAGECSGILSAHILDTVAGTHLTETSAVCAQETIFRSCTLPANLRLYESTKFHAYSHISLSLHGNPC